MTAVSVPGVGVVQVDAVPRGSVQEYDVRQALAGRRPVDHPGVLRVLAGCVVSPLMTLDALERLPHESLRALLTAIAPADG